MKKFLAVCSLMALAACSQASDAPFGNYKMINAPENAEITIRFDNGQFSGLAAVNRYFGSYTDKDGKIKFSPAGSTMMAGPENLMKVEAQYLNNLEQIETYQLKGNDLILNGKGISLHFVRYHDEDEED